MQIFNAKTQQDEDVIFSVDQNSEIVATFPDGHFLKFPAGATVDEIQALAVTHKELNSGQEVITPEQEAAMAAQRQASEDVVTQLNGPTSPESDKTNASPDSPDN